MSLKRCAAVLLTVGTFALGQHSLEPGTTIRIHPAKAASPSEVLTLQSGEAVWLTLEQGDGDLATEVKAPGEPSIAFDAFDSGTDPITVIADKEGRYEVSIRCLEGCQNPAGFTLKTGIVHSTGVRDRQRWEAALLAHRSRGGGRSSADLKAAAIDAGRSATLFEEAGEGECAASALVIEGTAEYSLDEFANAEKAFRKAVELPRRPDLALDADLWNNIGLCRRYLGFPDEALACYLKAKDTWQKIGTRTQGEASTLSNIGVLLCQMGECNQAIRYHLQSIAIFRQFNDSFVSGVAVQNLAAAYGVLGDNRSAAEYFETSLLLLRRAKGGERALARTVMNLGLIRIAQERYEEAQKLEQQALSLISGEDRLKADGLTDLCKVEVLLGNSDVASGHCQSAIAIYRNIHDGIGEGGALHNLGMALMKLARMDEAADRFGEALKIRRANKMPESQIETLTRLAQVETSRGRLKEAAVYASEAVDTAESTRARVTAERLRTSYFAAKQSSYETYIDVLMRLHAERPGAGYDTQAFEMAERRRARTLLDLLGETRSEIRRSASPDLLGRQRALAHRINDLTQQKNALEVENQSPDRQRALAREIDAALRDLELIDSQIRATDPRAAELLSPSPPHLAEIRSLLAENDALVEYALTATRSYAWVLTKSGLHSFVLPPRDRLESLAARVDDLLPEYRARTRDSSMNRRLQSALSALRTAVLGPIIPYLANRRIVVVPDGGLQLVPFAALLGRQRELVELPSAWTLAAKRQNGGSRQTRGRVAVFADPVFDASDPRVRGRAAQTRVGAPPLPRLMFSREEALAIEKLVPETLRYEATDFDASRTAFMSGKWGRYRYAHFSTHAVIDTERPELSSLVFSQVDPKGRRLDGRVRMYELFNLRTNSDLVTLSACRTGVGKQMKGEGLVGLTRAFLFAGAKSVLVTLWPVEDEGTAVFMREFYSRLLGDAKMAPAAALLGAQEAMRANRRWADPYYWAGFVLEGDWQ